MNYKTIETGNMTYLTALEGTSDLYWGMDYTSGDLFEAQELFEMGKMPYSNRVVFVKYPSGETYEPFKAEKGQYLGEPVFYKNSVYCLLVDFVSRKVRIMKADDKLTDSECIEELSLNQIKDCYNLKLAVSPLTVIRQGHDNDFQIIWPEEGDFTISNTESFYFRNDDELVFSIWYEDPDYREETVIRHYPDGEVITQLKGTLLKMDNGDNWLLK